MKKRPVCFTLSSTMIKKEITDPDLLSLLSKVDEDEKRVYTIEGGIRLNAVNCTAMANQVQANFSLGILERYVMAQAYIAASLLSSTVKGNDRVQMSIDCGGPIGGIYMESWACGAVRGYLKNNPIQVDKPLDSLDLNKFFGPGFLSISKILEGSKTPFTGQTMLEYGNLAKDLALYFQQSEQTPTIFSISVKFDRSFRIIGAGGIFLQALPDCPQELIDKLETLSRSLPSLGTWLSESRSLDDYIQSSFKGLEPAFLAKSTIMFSCPCSNDHFSIFLSKLPEDEKKAIMNKNQFPLELECFNCGTRYQFTKEQLEELFK